MSNKAARRVPNPDALRWLAAAVAYYGGAWFCLAISLFLLLSGQAIPLGTLIALVAMGVIGGQWWVRVAFVVEVDQDCVRLRTPLRQHRLSRSDVRRVTVMGTMPLTGLPYQILVSSLHSSGPFKVRYFIVGWSVNVGLAFEALNPGASAHPTPRS